MNAMIFILFKIAFGIHSQSLSYIFEVLILCLLCRITAPHTFTHSMMKWDDEQNTSYSKIHEELYATYINRNKLKNASLVGDCQYSNQNKLSSCESSTIYNLSLMGARNIMKLHGPDNDFYVKFS